MEYLYYVTTLATTAETTEKAGLFESLGIDVTMLVMQSIAFLALVWLLSKYVFPVLMRSIDEREAKIAEGQQAAVEAVKAAERAESATASHLAKAKKDVAEILERANKQAQQISEEAEARAVKKADHIIEQAEARIESDVADAKKALRSEMTDILAVATEKIIHDKLDAKSDAALIRRSLEDV